MPAPLVGFITDAEGNFDYWCRCVEQSRVVCFDSNQDLQFARPAERDVFVFGGDVFDKGPGDIRIASALVRLKKTHPDRVHLLVGNRDLNKLRLLAELAESAVDVPQPVPLYPRAPAQVSYREFLEKQQQHQQGSSVDHANSVANRLRWILDHTMTARGAFEHRRKELGLLKARGGKVSSGAHEGSHAGEPSDEDVVHSFVESVEHDDGIVWQYLCEGQLALLLGNTLFVHGGVPAESLGWVPSLSMRYRSPQEGETCGGHYLQVGHTVQQWVHALDVAYRAGLRDFRSQVAFRDDRSRGGEMLLCLTSTPACFSRSIVVESLLQAGMPTAVDSRVERYLEAGGVRRVVCGHKPCGDSPFIVRHGALEFVHGDTTFSDQGAPDSRGQAFAAVEIEGDLLQNSTRICGMLRDGSCYDCTLPALGARSDCEAQSRAAKRPRTEEEEESEGEEERCKLAPLDNFIGSQTADGWWVKARLKDGCYHVALSKPGDRNVSYKRVALP